jgi:ABC-2 type transport system ATP-binding protein
LEGDDLVQVGQFAWTFHSSGGMLVPVAPIKGVAVTLRGLAIDQRLEALDLEIPAGQLVAIVGASGSGKSTLLKAIVGMPGFRDAGCELVDNRDTQLDEAWFRDVLGYVSQELVIHSDLRNRQYLEFSARLRGHAGRPQQVDAILRQVDLPPERWAAVPGELSGGQRKRLQAAAELIKEPRLLLLDEPTSGLGC